MTRPDDVGGQVDLGPPVLTTFPSHSLERTIVSALHQTCLVRCLGRAIVVRVVQAVCRPKSRQTENKDLGGQGYRVDTYLRRHPALRQSVDQ